MKCDLRSETSKNTIPFISISIPVLNEEANLDALYDRLSHLADRMANQCNLEFVFSDNHSDDASWTKLSELALKDTRVRVIRFSKNIGFQRSILANYLHTRGDAVMQLDADLQDPPEMLEIFLNHWKKGYSVVYGVRCKRKESFFINKFRRLGYWFIDRMSENPIPRDVGDFRLMDRKVIKALTQLQTPNPYLRGMIAGLGFNQIGISYDRSARVAGESKFNITRLIRLGLTAVFNHSTIPLRIATLAGVVMLGLCILGALYYVILRCMFPDLPQGLASIHILVLFGIGLQSLLLGVIGRIFITHLSHFTSRTLRNY